MKSHFLFLMLCVSCFLFACSEPDNKFEDADLETINNSQAFQDYNKQHKALFRNLHSLQKNIDVKAKEELNDLFRLYQNDPKRYENLMKEKIVSLIGEKKYEALEGAVTDIQNSANVLASTTDYSELTDMQKEKLQEQLLYNLPNMSKILSPKRILTRSVSESGCLQDCADARDEAIASAAKAALCGMAVGLATCIATGGFGSVAGLIAAFVAAYQGDLAIENAQNNYNRCIKYC